MTCGRIEKSKGYSVAWSDQLHAPSFVFFIYPLSNN